MRIYYRLLRIVSQAMHAVYFQGRVFGLSNVPAHGGVLLASSHQSYLDPVAIALPLYREANFMARDTLFRQPTFKRLIESLNAFPVKRGAADVGAVKEMLRRLKDGKVVIVFPEATRTRDGSLGEINANSLLIAKKAGVTIVPTVVDGAFAAWPRGQILPAPSRIYISYCKAITPAQVKAWPIEEIAAVVSSRLHAQYEASQRMRARAAMAGRFRLAGSDQGTSSMAATEFSGT